MNEITLRDFLRFIDDDMRLHIQMTDSNGDVRSVSGFVRDLVVMLGAETLNRKVEMMMQTVLHENCVGVYPTTEAEDMQDENLPALNELLNEYPAILENLENDGIVTTAKLISLTASELRAVDRIGSSAICKIRTSLAKNGLHLKGEKL